LSLDRFALLSLRVVRSWCWAAGAVALAASAFQHSNNTRM